MANFSLFETFFFITLAITFILILLLVYHFKQRITIMEERCDKMFDIIQTISQELNRQRMPMSFPMPQVPNLVKLNNLDEPNPNIMMDFVKKDQTTENEMVDFTQLNNELQQYHIQTGNTEEFNDEDTHEDIEQEESDEESDEESGKESDEEGDDEESDDEESDDEIGEEKKEEIQIKKIEVEPVSLEQIGNSVIEEDKMDVYRKMNVNELKQKVIEKGLSTNPGKMKKGDLLNLLENE